MKTNFVEICIYEVKAGKEEEFENLMKEVGEIRKQAEGYVKHSLLKRKYRQGSFKEVQEGKPAIELSDRFKNKPTTYILYWECKDKETHVKATQKILKGHYKIFRRCLQTIPKIILCDNLNL